MWYMLLFFCKFRFEIVAYINFLNVQIVVLEFFFSTTA